MNQERASAAGEVRPTVKESCERIGSELGNLLHALAPSDEVLEHFRAARVEVLKGLRAAIDAQIERVGQDQRKGTAVSIE